MLMVEWTKREIRLIRRNIAYHQHRPLRTVGTLEARAVLNEQQRRREIFFPGDRYTLSSWQCGPSGKHPCAEIVTL